MSTAFLFGGQGCERPGMGLHLPKHALDPLLDLASEAIGTCARRLLERGGRGWGRTEVLQPLLVAVGLATARSLPRPTAWAGHSLGEYTAWVAAGGCGDARGIGLARRRGLLMRGIAGGMVVGPAEGLELAVVNPGERIYAGPLDACRGRRLEVAGPWHSSLMAPAATAFAEELGEVRAPAGWVHSGSGLARGIASTFRWDQVLKQLSVRDVVICGPARALRRHVAAALPDVRIWPTDTHEDLERAMEAMHAA